MKGVVTASVEDRDCELLTVKVPRGTGFGLGTELELARAGTSQSFPLPQAGKRVINTTASLEANTQQFKG